MKRAVLGALLVLAVAACNEADSGTNVPGAGWVEIGSEPQGARIFVDGKLVTTIHLGTGTTAYRQIVFRKVFGGSATHRITIKPVGNGHVTVDGFLALR